MHRPSLRMLAPTLALSCVLAISACDSTGPTPAELDPQAVEGLEPALGITAAGHGWRGTEAAVFAYPDGTEPLGRSWLQRRRKAVRFKVRTGDLTPGHAYTLWMVIFNNPAGCAADDDDPVCNDFDLFNAEAQPDMVFAAGKRVGASGRATFVGRRRVGTLRGSVNGPVGLPSNGLTNPRGADIRFVVHDHGPASRAYMPDMIRSIDGG